MPKDKPDEPPTIDDAIQSWVDKFNKIQGWKSIEAPQSKDGKRYHSPLHRFEEATSKAQADALEATKAKRKAAEKVKKLEKLIAKLPDGDKKHQAEEALEQAQERLADATASLSTATAEIVRSTRVLRQLTEVEKDLDEDLKKVSERIASLQDALGKQNGAPLSGMSKEDKELEFKIVQQMRDGVARNIDRARDETFKINKNVDGQEIERRYAVICSEEYKILHAMLDEAMLMCLTSDIEGAKAAIHSTSDQLALFRTARTGARIIEQSDNFDSRLSNPLGAVSSTVGSLRHDGFTTTADELEAEAHRIRAGIKQVQSLSADTLVERFGDEVTQLAKRAERQIERARECKTLITQIDPALRTLRVMDANDQADGFDSDYSAAMQERTPLQRRSRLEKLAKNTEIAIKEVRASQTSDAKIDTKALQQKLLTLQIAYADLFKTDRKGNVRMQKDSQTRELKGVKKDSKIPREAIDEIEMKLRAAQQLLETDSIDALKTAQDYLASIETYETSVTENSDQFKQAAETLKTLKDKIAGLKSKYGAYEPSRTLELEREVEQFEVKYKAMDPKVARRISSTLYQRMAELKADIRKCAAKYKEVEKSAKKVDGKLKSLSKVMQNFTIDDLKLSGYYGKYVAELAQARSTAEERDLRSLNRADTQILDLRTTVDTAISTAQKRLFEGSRDKLDGQELQVWTALKSDAVDGQNKQTELEQKKKEFEAKYKTVKARFKTIQKNYKNLKLDTSDVDLAVQEISSLEAETKASKEYAGALKRLEELEKDADNYEITSAEMDRFKKLAIDAAATECVTKIRNFRNKVETFDGEIKKIGKIDEIELDDQGTVMSENDVKAYLASVAAFIHADDLTRLETNAKKMDEELEKKGGDPRKPREAALGAVRNLMRALNVGGPLAHFRQQPFTSGNPDLDAAVASLPRLEIKLLTAISD
ncbi:hypothetical protein [Qingshengfaniella alkalisoli]|uniref:Uncharacterized protein n=1 Tax=Qingshengfaniella alkalisoli TaxID=2599296 RepID=A0A5B8IX95_9RHOB|nr:hypothetical protein [Qingshengfaniella alkalisoli]QDY70782.1 hypothetical protein FPZ52_13795 [Qingshengfaniella alkalisoli]